MSEKWDRQKKTKQFLKGCDYYRIFWKVGDFQPLLLLFPLLYPHTMSSCCFHVYFAKGVFSWLVPIQHVVSM